MWKHLHRYPSARGFFFRKWDVELLMNRLSSCQVQISKGDIVPPVGLKDQDGKLVNLDKFRGKPLVLYFYPADETPGCTKQACAFRDSYEKFKRAGAEVVGVSGDTPESHKVQIHSLHTHCSSQISNPDWTSSGLIYNKRAELNSVFERDLNMVSIVMAGIQSKVQTAVHFAEWRGQQAAQGLGCAQWPLRRSRWPTDVCYWQGWPSAVDLQQPIWAREAHCRDFECSARLSSNRLLAATLSAIGVNHSVCDSVLQVLSRNVVYLVLWSRYVSIIWSWRAACLQFRTTPRGWWLYCNVHRVMNICSHATYGASFLLAVEPDSHRC